MVPGSLPILQWMGLCVDRYILAALTGFNELKKKENMKLGWDMVGDVGRDRGGIMGD